MDKEIIDWLVYLVNFRIEELENEHDPIESKEEIKMANYVRYKLEKLQDVGDI
tara:strand:+ start:1399 stop:1557 length:159 start_codon:yes stop_codon:yes gene_type:complete